jgi:predicted PurR-regulated permease PerM
VNSAHKELVSMLVTAAILIATLYISHHFLIALAWAGVLGITTYPLYRRWKKLFGHFQQVSAFIFTSLLFTILLLPISWIISILLTEMQLFVNYIQNVNNFGEATPIWLSQIPLVGHELSLLWQSKLGNPGDIKNLFQSMHISLSHTSYLAKQIGTIFAHTGIQVVFTFLTLFFFYRDGESLFKQIHRIGENCLSTRWSKYADQLPKALRATVNGTILVGMGVGVLMGLCYRILGITAPTILGFITAFGAMIPFVVPVILTILSISLIAHGAMWSAMIVVAWGTIVMFVADHFVKPVLIGGAIELPFMGVLFGILGGVETMGILGLFIGPIIMVLFFTLWNESQD